MAGAGGASYLRMTLEMFCEHTWIYTSGPAATKGLPYYDAVRTSGGVWRDRRFILFSL